MRRRVEELLTQVAGALPDRVEPAPGPIVLLGAGEVGRNAMRVLARERVEVVCFADSNPSKWSGSCLGLPILSPSAAANRFGGRATFVVAYQCDDEEFRREMRRLDGFGVGRVEPLSSLLLRWPEIAGWPAEPPEFYATHATEVLRAFDLLADEESRRQYLGHLRWRILRDYSALPSGAALDQYFVPEIVPLRPDERFVDGGAFDGDTIRSFFWYCGGAFQSIDAFEPDPGSYARLTTFLAGLPPVIRERIRPCDAAIADGAGEVRFTALGSHSSAIGAEGDSIPVRTVSLDGALAGQQASFIKFDLEGGEHAALQGAEHTIREHRPIVTLAVYHAPGDLFSLPLLLASQCSEYTFHLRTHNRYGLDVVFYAVPRERRRATA